MIEVNEIQGSAGWHKLRAGHPTASCFKKIVLPPKPAPVTPEQIKEIRSLFVPRDKAFGAAGLAREFKVSADVIKKVLDNGWEAWPGQGMSEQAWDYTSELIAERVMGGPVSEFRGTEWTERGLELEGEVADWYEVRTGLKPRPVGFIWMDDNKDVGCSPDWLVDSEAGTEGGCEVKCPGAKGHVNYMRRFLLAKAKGNVPKVHVAQTQGCLWVTGLPWWDFVSYHPSFPTLYVRSYPDPLWFEAFDKHIPDFCTRLEDEWAHLGLKELGE